MIHRWRFPLLVLLLGTPVCVLGADKAPSVHIHSLGERGIQPQVVRDVAGTVHLLTYRGDAAAGDVWYSRRSTGEPEFSTPLQVNSQAGSAIAVGSIRGAQLAVGAGGRVHVVWNGSGKAEPRGPGKYDSPLLYSRLNDAGTGFEPQRDVIGSAYVLDGGSSVAADATGRVFVLWHAGSTGEENRRVWLARSEDEGRTFTRETSIDLKAEGACGCCGLKAGADQEGNVYVLFRSAREKQNRDMQLLRSGDGGQTFATTSLGRWNTAVCPMSSAALAESPTEVVLVWETQGQIELARINKQTGQVSKVARATGSGPPRRLPAVAINPAGVVLVAWTEGTGWQKGGDLAWQMFGADDRPLEKPSRAKHVPVWSFAGAWVEETGDFSILY